MHVRPAEWTRGVEESRIGHPVEHGGAKADRRNGAAGLTLLLISLAAALVCGVLGTVLWQSGSDPVAAKDGWVEHTHEVIEAAGRLTSAVSDAEANARTFLWAHTPDHLAAFDAARKACAATLTELIALTRDNPAQQARLAALGQALSARMDVLDRKIALARVRRDDEVLALQHTGEGDQLGKRVRQGLAGIGAEETRLLAEREADAARERAATLLRLRAGCAAFLLIVLLGCVAGAVAWSRQARLTREIRDARRRADGAELLRLLVATSPVGMAHSREDGTVVAANPAYLRALGATEDDLRAGRVNWLRATPPDRRPQMQQILREVREHGSFGPFEKEYALPDGQRRSVLVAVARLNPAAGDLAAFVIDLTESRRMEAELAETSQVLRGVFASASDCMTVLDLDGRLLALNAAARQKLGLHREDEVLGRPWDGIWPGAQGGELQAARSGEQGRFTAPTTDDEGQVRWWDVIVAPLLDAAGQPWRLFAISRNITALKESEAALQQSQARLRSIVETAADGIVVASADGRIVSANPAALRMFGYEAEADIVGRDLGSLMPASDAARHGAYLAAHRSGAPPRAIGVPGRDLIARRRDGSEFPIALSVSSFQTDQGLCVTGMIRDVTLVKQAEAALKDRGARLDLALQCAALGVYEVDNLRGAVRYDVRASALSDGLIPPDTWLPMNGPEFRHWLDRTHPEDAASRAENVAAILDGSTGSYERSFRVATPAGGWRHLFCSATILERDGRDGRATRVVGVLADVTDRVEAEALLERTVRERTAALVTAKQALEAEMQRREDAQAALLQAQKMEALGQLTSGVAHDFNNVLSAIVGVFHFIGKQPLDERSRRYVGQGERAVERAMALVRQLLAFARRERLEAGLVEVDALLAGVESLVEHSLRASIRLVVRRGTGLWPVLADRNVLEVALLNLAVNARDAMPDGGTLTVEARNTAVADGEVEALAPGDYLAIAVTDTGMGMPPEVREQALTPFFTTKGPGKGTGLGLSMVNDFARRSGGAVAIRSAPGAGTTVEIYLPRTDASAVAEPSHPVPDAAARERVKILLVENDDGVRSVTAAYLQDLGHAVIEAESARAAYAAFQATPDLDLVVSDIAMPGEDGLALAARIRAARPGLPIVFVAGYTTGRTLAGEQVLAKPFDAAALGRLVRAGLGAAAPDPDPAAARPSATAA